MSGSGKGLDGSPFNASVGSKRRRVSCEKVQDARFARGTHESHGTSSVKSKHGTTDGDTPRDGVESRVAALADKDGRVVGLLIIMKRGKGSGWVGLVMRSFGMDGTPSEGRWRRMETASITWRVIWCSEKGDGRWMSRGLRLGLVRRGDSRVSSPKESHPVVQSVDPILPSDHTESNDCSPQNVME